MSLIKLEWLDDEQTILFSAFPKKWTVEDLIDYVQRGHDMVENTPHDNDVYAIVDYRESGNPPAGIISQFPRLADLSHPRSKRTIMVSQGGGLRNMLMDLFSRTFGLLDTARTVEEAHEQINTWKAKNS